MNINDFNRAKMNGLSVYDIDVNLLIEQYNKLFSIRKTLLYFNISTTGTQIHNLSKLLTANNIEVHSFFCGKSELEVLYLVRDNIDKSIGFYDLLHNCGLIPPHRIGKGLSRTTKIKLVNILKKYNISYTHLISSERRDRRYKQKNTEIFVLDSSYTNETIKKHFLKRVKYECNTCGISEWNNSKLILQLDHIDGNPRNNILENLRLLCPNCHSQTNTFSGRKRNSTI